MSGTHSLDSVIAVVRQALAAAPEPRSADRPLATVEPVGDDSAGWYRVTRQLGPAELDYITEGQLTRGAGPRAATFDVLEVAVDGDLVRVRASVTAPRERLSLTVRGTGLRRVLQGLTDGLNATRANPLLSQFSARRLTPVHADHALPASAHAWSSLKPAQRDAVAACCAPGLHLVWGPPGTGKTHVIATSISHLVRSGRRVLLVSNTNIAVDTALEQALRLLDPSGPGAAVRVGNVLLPDLQADDRVRLDRLVQARQAQAQHEVDRLAEQLAALSGAGTRLADVADQLTGFDPEAFQRATRRVANRREYDRVIADVASAEAELSQAQAQARDAEHQRLAFACRQAVAREDQLATDLGVVEAALTAHQQSALLARARRPGRKGRLRAHADGLRVELAEATVMRRQAIDTARAAGADPDAGVPDSDRISSAIEQATRRVDAAGSRLARLRSEAHRLTRNGLATSADQTLVTAEQQRWRLHQSVPGLREAVRQADGRRRDLERAYGQALRRVRDERHGLEKEIVAGARVVATTLTQIALRPWLTATPYDHVIVDEAAAAALPHVMHAVGRATTGAVLVGDYLQNGPIVEASFPGGDDARQLFGADCFGHFGATDPARAQATPGCVVLTEQFRFGPALTELANRVAYRGLLTTAGASQADIVVVTADGLPEDITTVHRGASKQAGWWLIGALLARALAEHHNDAGAQDAFGVVVPYKAQADATRAALNDSSLARLTPVGTSHSYQGRQFEVVLADLVEDGRGRMSAADLGGGQYDIDSVRLFNVAATRAQRRLYVLVGRGALERATKGPLAALNAMVRSGTAHRIDADQLLGLAGTDPPPPDSPGADLIAALSPYVRVAGLHDEDAAIDEIIARIDAAQRSVWCWSAWVGAFAEDIISALERAHRRGVTVHVVARPERQVQPANQESLRRLAARLPHLVRMRDMHQKIVVVDEQWSIIGSFNALSHGPTSSRRLRDLMVTMDGAHFAGQLLRQELAAELAQRRRCPTCNDPLTECGLTGKGRDRGWAWICPPPCNDGGGTWRLFPATDPRARPRRNDPARA